MRNFTRQFAGLPTALLGGLACVFFSINPSKINAQPPNSITCEQIEILFEESECFERKDVVRSPNSENPCKNTAVCEDKLYNYTASITGSGWTYLWTVTGPVTVIINPSNTASAINITWSQQGNFVLTLTATDGAGNIFTSCLNVSVKEAPIANFTFTPNNVCSGSTISFTNTSSYSSGPIVYSWSFGDPTSINNSSSATNPTHLYANSGTFPVTLIACSFKVDSSAQGHNKPGNINTCCCDTITKNVTILPGMIKIECISTVCAKDTSKYTILGCTNPSVSIVGGTLLSQLGNMITVVWGNGNPQGQILASCGGCTASVPVPIIPTNPIITGNLNPCYPSTGTYTLPLLPGTFYTWTLYNSSTSTFYNYLINTFPDNNTVFINWGLVPPGTYQLSVHLENKHICCESKGSVLITPLPKWVPYQDKCICEGDIAFLSASPNPTGAIYNWNVTGGIPTSGTTNIFNPTFVNAGNYLVSVTENSTGNFCNSGLSNPQFINITVKDRPNPGPIVGLAKVCPGSNNYSYNMLNPPPLGYYYVWTISGGCGTFQPGGNPTTTSNAVSINWTSLPCTISVVLQRNGFPQCPSVPVTLMVMQAQIGNIVGNNTVCADNTNSYSLSGTLPPGEIYNWIITPPGAGTIISGQGTPNVMIQWHGSGSSASLMATSNCGNATFPIAINLPGPGTITQAGTDLCFNVSLSTASGGTNYLWYYNGSLISGANSNSIPITQGGIYSVTYLNSSGCKVSATINVPSGNPCNLLVTSPDPLVYCIGDPISTQLLASFGPGCTNYTYQWCLNGNPILGATLPTYTANLAGTYVVKATKGNCLISETISISEVICVPSGCTTACNPQTGTFTTNNNSSPPICNPVDFTTNGYNNVTVYFGDGNSTLIPSPSTINHFYTNPGYYTVYASVPCLNTPCVEIIKNIVFVPISPDFKFDVHCDTAFFTDLSQIYIGTSGPVGNITNWNWDFGDFGTSTGQNPTHIYSGPGNYTISLTTTYVNGTMSCTSTISHQVIITAPGTPPITIAPLPVCTNMPSTFSTTLGFLNYEWKFDDGFFGYSATVEHAYTLPGTYTVQLTVSDLNGCSSKNIVTINVKPGIDSCKILPASFCPGSSATLSITGPPLIGATYSWQTNSGPAPGINNLSTYQANTVGFYHVIVTASNGCTCTSNTVEVKVSPKPIAAILASPSIHFCGPGNLALYSTNHLIGYTSAWYTNGIFGPPLSTNQAYYVGNITSTTTYNLILTNEYGCMDTCDLEVTVDPVPADPIISATPTSCEGVPITLTVTNYSNNISWNTGASTISIVVYAAGVYTATYTNPVTGCTSSKDYIINRRPPLDLFPHFCDSIPCTCRDSNVNFTLYAPLPLVGAFATNYNIQWYLKPSTTPIGTGPTFSPAQSGTYCIVATDPATGCKDTSDTYTVVVAKCDTCECGTYEFLYSIGRGPLLPKNCGDTLDVPSSGAILPIRFYSSFHCNGTNCPDTTKVDWILTGPKPFIPISMNGVDATPDFTIPITNATFAYQGLYTLMVTGYCNGKPCPPCKIYFKADGHDCCSSNNNGDFCTAVMNAVSVSVDPIKCKATLNIGNLPKCDSIVSISWGDGTSSGIHYGAGSMPMHTYSSSGTYVISWLAIEYDDTPGQFKICFEKVFTDTIRLICNNCVCSKSEISLEHNGLAYLLGCNNKTITKLGCPATDIVISGFFGCVGDSCLETVVSYELQTPSLLIPGFTTNYPLLTFPANLVSDEGIYCLTLKTVCPGSPDTCVCKIYWYQPECDTCICPTRSEISLEHNGLAYLLGCNDKKLTTLGCPATDIVISGFYGCEGDSCTKTPVSYELQTPSLLIPGITSNLLNLTFPANLVNEVGTYCLTLTTTCPGSLEPCICRVCWYQPECDTCCKNYDLFCKNITNAVNITTDPKLCKATVNIGNLPKCDVISSINWGDGLTSSGPFTSGTMPMHTYSGSGTYIISWLALEYNYSGPPPPKICFEKIFRDTITITCDSCECAGISPLSFFNTNWPTANLPVKCGKSYQLPCIKPGQNPIFYFHGNMNCDKDSCTSKDVTWQIIAMPLGNIITSGSTTLYPLLGGAHFDITLNQTWFSPNVLYMITVTGKCGTKTCSCKVNFRFAACPCPCDNLFADVNKGFSVSGNSSKCSRTIKPLGLCSGDVTTWTITGTNSPTVIPNPSTGNAPVTVSFPYPGGIYYVCMSVKRINPLTGKLCPTYEYCQKVIVKCKQFQNDTTRYFNTCKSNLIKNGDFDSGLTVGQLGAEGKVANWNLFSNVGDGYVLVDDSTGAYDEGHLILVGGKDNFAGILQTLSSPVVKLDSFTVFDYSIRNYSEDEVPEGTVLEFRLQENSGINSPSQILFKQKIDATINGWSSRSFSIKATSSNFDYRNLVICAQNSNAELRSAIGIDNIEVCISTLDIVNTNNLRDYSNLSIYPNPTDGTFIIDLQATARSGLSYKISDVTGRNLLTKSIFVGSQTQSVDVSSLSSGLYFIQITSNGKVLMVKKLIKQ